MNNPFDLTHDNVPELVKDYHRELEQEATSEEYRQRMREAIYRRLAERSGPPPVAKPGTLAREKVPAETSSTAVGDPEAFMRAVMAATRRYLMRSRKPSALRELKTLRTRAIRQARRELRRRLDGQVAALMAGQGASFAWLFLKTSDLHLEAVSTFSVAMPDYAMAIAGNGVVPHVVRNGSGERWDDVGTCPYYERAIESTRSLLAVPVKTPDGRLIGVLNLESPNPGQFRAGSVERLQQAALVLVPELLCLEAIHRRGTLYAWPWHPRFTRGGWALTEALGVVCHAAAHAIHPDMAGVTVWAGDWEKRAMFAVGSSELNEELLTKSLPTGSKTYRAVTESREPLTYTTPQDPDFHYKELARTTGMNGVYIAPVYPPGAVHTQPTVRALGACSLYLYQTAGSPEVRAAAQFALPRVADRIGEMWASYQALRREVASAYLQHRLVNRSPYATEAEVVRDVIVECLDADGCTILEHDPGRKKLVLAVSTGVANRHDEGNRVMRSGCNGDTEEYDTDSNGIMPHLARHPGLLVRKNNLMDDHEPGVPHDLPEPDFSRPLWDDDMPTRERRFLATSVASSRGTTMAVVRVVRPMTRPPFLAEDAELLAALMAIWGPRLEADRPVEEPEEQACQEVDLGGEG